MFIDNENARSYHVTIMFVTIVITTLMLMYLYIGSKIADMLVGSRIARTAFQLLSAILMVSIHISPYYIRTKWPAAGATDSMFWASYILLGFFSILFIAFLLGDTFISVAIPARRWMRRVRSSRKSGELPDVPKDPGKRLFLYRSVNLGMIGLSAGLTGYGISEARRRPAVVSRTIPITNLHPDLANLRIAMISDIHVSSTIKRPFVEAVVEITNSLSPDLIAITGDMVDGTVGRLREDVAPLSRLAAPLGTYFVTGNHEYYSGARVWIEEFSRLGCIVLENQHRIVRRGKGRLLLAGVNDYHAGRFYASHASSPAKALRGANHHHTRILLAHQPRSIFEAARAGYHLQLSGHTHGGQYYPWQCLVALNQPYVSGLHKHGNTWIYVSRGTGYWGPPVRLGSPSEITDIRLVAV